MRRDTGQTPARDGLGTDVSRRPGDQGHSLDAPDRTSAGRLWNQSTEPRLILRCTAAMWLRRGSYRCDDLMAEVHRPAPPLIGAEGAPNPLAAGGGRSSGSQFGEMTERVAQMLRRERRKSDVLSDGVRDC